MVKNEYFFSPYLTITYTKDVTGLHNIHGYTGHQYDIGTGLHYAQARYYMSETGRFISEDTNKGHVLKPLSMNSYIYVWNNSLRYMDPNGESAVDITYGITTALDDNLTSGLLKELLRKINKHTGVRINDSDYDYYLGQVIGDALSAIIGSGISFKGLPDIAGSIIFGGGVTVMSGGVPALGGMTICVAGVTAGTMEFSYGGTVITAAGIIYFIMQKRNLVLRETF